MKVTKLDESVIQEIGHAFGYYDYGEETGLPAAFSGKEATAEYLCAYVRGMLRGGFLYAAGERSEGFIAYKLLGGKARLQDPLAHREGHAARLEPEAAYTLRHGHRARRRDAPEPVGQGKEAVYLRRHGLRA